MSAGACDTGKRPLSTRRKSPSYLDLLQTQLQETGEIRWPMGWSLRLLNEVVETLGIDPARVMLIGSDVKVARS